MSSTGFAVTTRTAWARAGGRVVFGLVVVAGLWLTVGPPGGAGRGEQVLLAAAAVAALLGAGRWPLCAVVVSALATLVAWQLGLTADPFLMTGFAVFAVAERGGSRRFPRWMLVAAGIAAIGALGLSADGVEDRFRGMLLGVMVLGASWVLGVRTRQARLEAAARSRAEERMRLARDVHDVLSHSLGTIGVQAGIAAHVQTLGETELRGVLGRVAQDARRSLAELRELLSEERAAGSGAALGLSLSAELAEIAQTARRAGVPAVLEITGEVDGLPAAVRTTVHRVVQEAVTNVVRHAESATVRIAVRAEGLHVDVSVSDDGPGASPRFTEGHGLTGMRERVALLGGTLRVDSAASGFTVAASFSLSKVSHAGGDS